MTWNSPFKNVGWNNPGTPGGALPPPTPVFGFGRQQIQLITPGATVYGNVLTDVGGGTWSGQESLSRSSMLYTEATATTVTLINDFVLNTTILTKKTPATFPINNKMTVIDRFVSYGIPWTNPSIGGPYPFTIYTSAAGTANLYPTAQAFTASANFTATWHTVVWKIAGSAGIQSTVNILETTGGPYNISAADYRNIDWYIGNIPGTTNAPYNTHCMMLGFNDWLTDAQISQVIAAYSAF